MLCYMPTWSLTNAVAMTNAPAEKFPQIRVFGSIGWVASAVFSLIALKVFGKAIDGTLIPLYCGAGTRLGGGASESDPAEHARRRPRARRPRVVDVLGLRASALLKDLNFALFILISLLVMTPFTMYFSLGSQFFLSQGFKLVTFTMNWGQAVEMSPHAAGALGAGALRRQVDDGDRSGGVAVRYLPRFWAGGVLAPPSCTTLRFSCTGLSSASSSSAGRFTSIRKPRPRSGPRPRA